MRSLLAALAALLLLVAPVAAANPNRGPLTLSFEFGGPEQSCDGQLGYFEDDIHYRSWTGWMAPGESFSVALYFCPPGGANTGAYLLVQGESHYAVTFDCLNRYAEPCRVSLFESQRGKYHQSWRGCEADPNGWVTVTIRNDGSKAVDTYISAGSEHVGSAAWASRCP
jgi:hypothetical protein